PTRQSLRRIGAPSQIDSADRLSELTASWPNNNVSGSILDNATFESTLPMLQLRQARRPHRSGKPERGGVIVRSVQRRRRFRLARYRMHPRMNSAHAGTPISSLTAPAAN